jgi:hypothetical protein
MSQYRAEVGHRAEALSRRRQRRTVGAVAGAVVVAVVASAASVHAVDSTPHVSASAAGRAAPSARPPAPQLPGATSATAGGAGSARPQASAGSTNGDDAPAVHDPATGALAPGDFATIDREPSGASVTAGVGANVLVVLPVTPGRWGRAAVDHGDSTVLTVVSQRRVSGTTQIELRTRRPGTASFTVPVIGLRGAAWHGTVVVTADG